MMRGDRIGDEWRKRLQAEVADLTRQRDDAHASLAVEQGRRMEDARKLGEMAAVTLCCCTWFLATLDAAREMARRQETFWLREAKRERDYWRRLARSLEAARGHTTWCDAAGRAATAEARVTAVERERDVALDLAGAFQQERDEAWAAYHTRVEQHHDAIATSQRLAREAAALRGALEVARGRLANGYLDDMAEFLAAVDAALAGERAGAR